ncbi:MAG: hypothetical protein Q9185_006140 [Variospora sp. 1 TL-2023]
MSTISELDPTQKPPQALRAAHKFYQRVSQDALAKDDNFLDLAKVQRNAGDPRLSLVVQSKRSNLAKVFTSFENLPRNGECEAFDDIKVYEHRELSGLQFLPSLLPPCTQGILLSRLLHRDLSSPRHKTNVHFHHRIPYDRLSSIGSGDEKSLADAPALSFFHFSPDSSFSFPATDPENHKSLTLSLFLNRKLRWMTLGGQYDWTNKVYLKENQPDFPEDVASLVQGLFPRIRPEAAIVNLYSPGDTLSIHRDVSESCDVGLVSISLGCDGLFLIGLENSATGETKYSVVRLRSGDAVYMSGPSRFAWHSVPQILANTCPPWLSDWPASSSSEEQNHGSPKSDQYEAWRGWMANKRINVNVRQMND